MRLPVYNKGLAALLVLTLKGIFLLFMLRIHNIIFLKLPQRRPSLKRYNSLLRFVIQVQVLMESSGLKIKTLRII